MELTSNEDSISELFARDPLTWSEPDMARMVAAYRGMRKDLIASEGKPKATKASASKIPKEDLKGMDAATLLDKLGLGDL